MTAEPDQGIQTADAVVGVSALEQATGIASATLRMWERRYGFPHPARDARGARVYAAAQVAKLRLVARLMLRGDRPGDLVAQSAGDLQARLDRAVETAAQDQHPMLRLLKAMDHTAVMQQLLQQLAVLGLERFVGEAIPAAGKAVGDAWACGQLEPREEHLYSECVQQVLRAAIVGLPMPGADSGPRVVLATPAGEQHGIGLLMVQALLTQQLCQCLPLGRDLDAHQVAAAASVWRSDVVAISVGDVLPVRSVLAFLHDLRKSLQPDVEIWVGGSSKALQKPEVAALPRLRHCAHAVDVVDAVVDFRQRR